ncbi:MAG: D-alanine--D-alanine ligase [Pseudomonadota bacterium]
MSDAAMNPFGRIALAAGGDSAEREISLRSGRAVAQALDELKLDYVWLDGAESVIEAALAGRIDRVLNMLHGRGGEDGCLQGAMKLLGVPMTGSNTTGSAIAMDKLQTKRLWQACDLPTPDWRTAESAGQAELILKELPTPLFVKPVREGSSVGMTRIERQEQLEPAIARALEHDRMALVEQLIDGAEYTAAVLNEQALPLIRIETPREFYDYDAKYQAGDTTYHCPCSLPAEKEAELQQLAMNAFEVLGCSGWGRVDFMLDQSSQPWLLEANTVPGMTNHSLVPMAAKAAGMDFRQLVQRILQTSVSDEVRQ